MYDRNLINALCETDKGEHTAILKISDRNVRMETDGSPLALLFYMTLHCIENLENFTREHVENIYDTAKEYNSDGLDSVINRYKEGEDV